MCLCWSFKFTRATLASAGISCRVSVRPPSVTSRCSTKTAKHRNPKQRHTIAQGLLVCWRRKSRQNSNGVTPNGDVTCRWGRLNAGAAAGNWRLWTYVVNFVRSQVYHTDRPPYLLAARSSWCSASRRFVGDCWSLLSLVPQSHLRTAKAWVAKFRKLVGCIKC